jgi:hypothetical protein
LTITRTTTTAFEAYLYTDCTANSSYQSTLNNFDYIYGAQVEAGTFPTSYIPTGAATATRNADVASVSTSQFPYSATEGTLVANVTVLSTAPTFNTTLWSFYTDANNNIRSWIWTGAQGQPRGTLRQAGSQPADMLNGSITANTPFKNGFAYKNADFGYALNGSAATTVTTALALTNSYPTLDLGRSGSLGDYLNGHIRQITYIPRRLTNAELQTRTSA